VYLITVLKELESYWRRGWARNAEYVCGAVSVTSGGLAIANALCPEPFLTKAEATGLGIVSGVSGIAGLALMPFDGYKIGDTQWTFGGSSREIRNRRRSYGQFYIYVETECDGTELEGDDFTACVEDALGR